MRERDRERVVVDGEHSIRNSIQFAEVWLDRKIIVVYLRDAQGGL